MAFKATPDAVTSVTGRSGDIRNDGKALVKTLKTVIPHWAAGMMRIPQKSYAEYVGPWKLINDFGSRFFGSVSILLLSIKWSQSTNIAGRRTNCST